MPSEPNDDISVELAQLSTASKTPDVMLSITSGRNNVEMVYNPLTDYVYRFSGCYTRVFIDCRLFLYVHLNM